MTQQHQDPIDRFLSRDDEILRSGRLGLLCNHTAFSVARGEYLFESLDRRGNLVRLFVPEHGLFAELQDQVGLAVTEVYADLDLSAEIVSLYGDTEASLVVSADRLAELDAIVVDIQDVGSRYYTFATTLSYLFDTIATHGLQVQVFVIDRPNPAGTWVEGTPLPESYASFVGRPGLPHRHGLTIGELAHFYRDQSGADVAIDVQRHDDALSFDVAPSPNMPSITTALLYSGQCLLEGTNLSEGRGTTRPFELFGAPWLQWSLRSEPPAVEGATLRRVRFLPMFQKHAGELCYGFQIHLHGGIPYPSLAHSLQLLRWIRARSGSDFEWRTEAYEFRSDRPAIELLAGDDLLLAYLRDDASYDEVKRHLTAAENHWIAAAARWRLYEQPLRRF